MDDIKTCNCKPSINYFDADGRPFNVLNKDCEIHGQIKNTVDYVKRCDKLKSKNNTSGCTGVYWKSGKNNWVAKIKYKGTNIHLGTFALKKDAAIARKAAELKYSKGVNV